MINLENLNIKVFLDTANLEDIKNSIKKYSFIKGFTTNPSLMHKEGIKDYSQYAKEALKVAEGLPISFEVFSDDLDEMENQGRIINSWGGNSYVKIPITNTKGISTSGVIKKLSDDKIKINVTAIFTLEQIKSVVNSFNKNTPGIISIFAGRIADSGNDPTNLMKKSYEELSSCKNLEILWASTREIFNIAQAISCNSHIITIPPDILEKIKYLNKDPGEFSLDTVKAFYNDGKNAGFNINDD